MNGREKSNSSFSNAKYRLWKCPLLLITLFVLLNVCLCFSSEQENVANLTTHKGSPSPDSQAALRGGNGSISEDKNKVTEDLGEKPIEKVRARRGLLALSQSRSPRRRSPSPDIRRQRQLHNFGATLTNAVALFLDSITNEERKQRAFERLAACVKQLSPRVNPAVFLEQPEKPLSRLFESYRVDPPTGGPGTTMPLVTAITRILDEEGKVSFQLRRVLDRLFFDAVALFPNWPPSSPKITIPFTEEDKIELAVTMGLLQGPRRNAVSLGHEDATKLSSNLKTRAAPRQNFLESPNASRQNGRRNSASINRQNGVRRSENLRTGSVQRQSSSESSNGNRRQDRRNAVAMDDMDAFELSEKLKASNGQQPSESSTGNRREDRRNAVAMDDGDAFELSEKLKATNGQQPSESSNGNRRNGRRNGIALDRETGLRLSAGLQAERNQQQSSPPSSSSESSSGGSSRRSRTVRRNRRSPSRSTSRVSERTSWLQFNDPQSLINAQIPRQNEGSMFDQYADVFRYALITDLPEPTKKVVIPSSASSQNQLDGNSVLNNNLNGNDSGSTTAASNKSNEPSDTVDHHTKKSSKRHRSSRHKRREKRRLKRAMKAALENSAKL